MNLLIDPIRKEREYEGILETLRSQRKAPTPRPLRVTGLGEGAGGAFCAALIADTKEETGLPCLCLVPDEKEAVRTQSLLTSLGFDARMYPFRDFNFYDITASHEFEHERLSVLSALCDGSCDAVIATPDAALQYTIPHDVLTGNTRMLRVGDTLEPTELHGFLLSLGYTVTEIVDGPGQFASRGGICDVFPPKSETPIRIEWFDDEIDSIGSFDILSQRRIEGMDCVTLTPAREIILPEDKRAELIRYIDSMKKHASDDHRKERFSSEREILESRREARFLDKYISFLYPQRETLLDYVQDGLLLFREYASCGERLHAYEWRREQEITALLEDGAITSAFAEYGKTPSDLEAFLASSPAVLCDAFLTSAGDLRLSGLFSFTARQTVSYSDSLDLLREDLRRYLDSGLALVLLCENEIMARNLCSVLNEASFPAALMPLASQSPDAGQVYVVHGPALAGYELTLSHFALLSLYPARAGYSRPLPSSGKRKTKKKAASERILSYTDLEPGDYVVHASHGIGQYMGMDTVTAGGVTGDYLKIRYAGSDILYLPCDQLDTLSKYIGAHADDGTLKLSKMGGAEWNRTRAHVKAQTKEMAKELIKLYAERQRLPGYAFPADDDMQRAFEEAFEYEETESQLDAIEDIKADMQKTAPMDRLLCGDVGFGKTEVAMRAAFKAVEGGKQVAFLVPTTILALQHYQTLLARMRGFPIHIDMISRFRTPKQQAESLRRLKRGETDILVGTHRLVSSDVLFRDLGLVIVDEEQRFGVAHKEKLKQIAGNVDVLTLSATPIPRTMNMAMSGIRDMSLLEEAPGDRLPVQTYVMEYDDIIIAEAIKKELRRGGQVFYLHNRVETLDRVQEKVAAMVPDARIAVAHGQMDKELISDIWRSLIAGDLDVLITTTIIESGVDVPNANTLIVEDADRLGLSQLHQIRGRVGRSSRRAYAYFTYRKGAVLTEIASKRLGAIRDYTEFGSGFKVALRDMEIRGAGNLLGAEQHGNMDSVGYDLYMKLLQEAILEEKGEKAVTKPECTVDLGENAYIPESYIRSPAQRIDIYKKISLIAEPADQSDVLDELIDRFGTPPPAVSQLLAVSLIRSLGGVCGLSRIQKKETTITFFPETLDIARWTMMAAEYKGRLLLSLGAKPYLSIRLKRGEKSADLILEILKKYTALTL